MSTEPVKNPIIDISLPSESKKQRIRIGGDDSRIVELDTSFNIFPRVVETAEKLDSLVTELEALEIPEDSDLEAMKTVSNYLKEIDRKMREAVDYVFNSPVSDVCAPDSNMYDLHDGVYKFEEILEALAAVYGEGMNQELQKMRRRMEKHTAKYVKTPTAKKRGK